MKKFQYKGKKYNVPTSWDEITLEQYIKMRDDEKEFKTEATKQLAYISGFANIPIDVLKKSKVNEVSKLFKYLTFLNKNLPNKSISSFEFKGERYSVADTLLKQEFQDYISFETAIADTDGDIYRALPMLIAIMCKREGEGLDDYDLHDREKLFMELPVTIAHSLSVFFWNSEKMSNLISQISSNQEKVIQMKAKSVLNTLQIRAGTGWLTRLLIGLLRSYIKSIIPKQRKSYISLVYNRFIARCKKIYIKLVKKLNIN